MNRLAAGREGGFALLLVLSTMALMALMVARFIGAGRTELQIAANVRAAAVNQEAADGAVHEAILRLIQGVRQPDGRPQLVTVGGVPVESRIWTQARKVNPNTAPAPVLQALLVAAGMDSGKAAVLAQAIEAERHPQPAPKPARSVPGELPNAQESRVFNSLDELKSVLGMNPELMARLAPLLSVYQEGDMPEPADAFAAASAETSPPPADPWYFGASGRIMVVVIEARASGGPSGQFARRAVVRLRAEPSLDQAPFQILTWEIPWQ